MNILAICPAIPAKDAKGFQVQAYHRLRYLSQHHRVEVVCFGQGDNDEKHKSSLTALGIRVRMVPWNLTSALFSSFKALFNPAMPLQCAVFSSLAFRKAILANISDLRPDVIHATTIRVLPNLDDFAVPLILDLVDSMALNFRRRAQRSSWWLRPLWWFEHRRVARYERVSVQRSVASFVVSAVDQAEMDTANVHVLPLGIDTDHYKKGTPATEPVVVLTGNMAYRPNIEAALWMAHNCWPAVRYKVKNATFLIAGNRPTTSVKNLGSDQSICVAGQVASMADILRNAQVAVAPMQSGSGMQFKILEAMACGIPVVTTTLGLGDIKAEPGEHLLVSDSPVDFIESTLSLLQSWELREKIGKSGSEFIKKNHTWNAINEKFEEILVAQQSEYR